MKGRVDRVGVLCLFPSWATSVSEEARSGREKGGGGGRVAAVF